MGRNGGQRHKKLNQGSAENVKWKWSFDHWSFDQWSFDQWSFDQWSFHQIEESDFDLHKFRDRVVYG